MRQIKQAAFLMLAAGVALTGCGSGGEPQATRAPTGGESVQTSSPAGSPAGSSPAGAAQVSVQLAWSHLGKSGGDQYVWYVAKVTNGGSSPASVALDALALDSTGTSVGHSQETLPNIPAHSDFDFFGELGNAFTQLTGTPQKVEVSVAEGAFGQAGSVFAPMLKTSEVTLAASNEDNFSDMTHSYNLTAKVTNTTGQPLAMGVTQQAVLYNQAGQIVGGGSGSSDDVPDNMQPDMSYRESWTGIPAEQAAAHVEYTVWPAD